jgi:hypothetical protein
LLLASNHGPPDFLNDAPSTPQEPRTISDDYIRTSSAKASLLGFFLLASIEHDPQQFISILVLYDFGMVFSSQENIIERNIDPECGRRCGGLRQKIDSHSQSLGHSILSKRPKLARPESEEEAEAR